MFFGKHILRLSETNQLILPSNYQLAMSNPIYLTQGFDRNLLLLSQQTFNAMYSHVTATSYSDPLARLMSRLFLAAAVEIAIDGSAQIELPPGLCEYAGLGKEIIMVGQGDYSEIWSSALWQNQMDNLNDYEANAHRFEKFHVSLS